MQVLADIQQAWRSLRRDPATSLLVLVILAVGISATVSVYSIASAVVLRPLPYASPDRLVQIRLVDPAQGFEYDVSGPTYLDWKASITSIGSLSLASGGGRPILEHGDAATRVRRASTTGDFFSLLGARPALGRLLAPADAEAGAAPVAVLSHDFWQEGFGGDPSVLGRVIRIEGEPHQVVGVADPDLDLPAGTEVWTPLSTEGELFSVRYAHVLGAYGRLAGDVTAEAAQAELDAVLDRVEGYEYSARVVPLKARLVGDVRTPLLILLGAVVFVLLIAAANAGTLLLARAVRRRRELAIRGALGAGWTRIAAQLMAESSLLAVLAGVMGVLVAGWILDGLVALAPADLPRADQIHIDGGILLFALGVSLATGALAGLIPALRGARTAPASDLKEGDARGGGLAEGRAQRAFVLAQVALSMVLLFGAGLLGRSFSRMLSAELGFVPERVTTFAFSLPEFRYPEAWQVLRYHDEVLEQIRALPGVARASLTRNLPVGGSYMVTPAVVEGVDLPDPPRVQVSAVAPEYFETMGMALGSGRSFSPDDGPEAPPVAVVNEAFARLYLDGEDPVGRRARTYFGEPVMREIVGVVGSVIHGSPTEPPEPKFYYPAAQFPPWSGHVVVRSDAPPAAVIEAVRAVARRVDPDVPLVEVATLSQLLARTTARPRFYAFTLGAFAATALLLTLAGFFAVLSQAVTRRRRELAIRTALGARSRDLFHHVVREGMTLTAVGVAVGTIGALAAARLLRGLLYQVGPADPVVLLLVAILFGVVALAAAWIPARRASRTDPAAALRAE
jgi:putative ABC transport system permease protein